MYIAAIEEAGLKKKPDRPIGYLDGRTSEVKQQQQQLLMLSAAPSLTSRQRRGFREKKKQPDRALSEIKKKKGKLNFLREEEDKREIATKLNARMFTLRHSNEHVFIRSEEQQHYRSNSDIFSMIV